MAIITTILGYLEPFLALVKYITGRLPHSRLSVSEFEDALNKSFDELLEYVETYGLKKSDFAPAEKDLYMKHVRQKFGFKNGHFTKVIQGQPEVFFYNDLLYQNRIDLINF